MKKPEEYLCESLSAHYGVPLTPFAYRGVSIPLAAAEAAVAAALADGDRYRENLMRAIRNSKPQLPATGALDGDLPLH